MSISKETENEVRLHAVADHVREILARERSLRPRVFGGRSPSFVRSREPRADAERVLGLDRGFRINLPPGTETASIYLTHTIGVFVNDQLTTDDWYAVKDLANADSRFAEVVLFRGLDFEFRFNVEQLA